MASDEGVPGAGCISLWSTTTESIDRGSMVKRGCVVRVLGDKRDGAGKEGQNVEDRVRISSRLLEQDDRQRSGKEPVPAKRNECKRS